MAGHGNPNWKPGQSGNPAGRPKGDSFGDLVRKQKGLPRKLLSVSLGLLESSDESVRLKAAVFLKESGWGKATQPIEGEVTHKILNLIFPTDNA